MPNPEKTNLTPEPIDHSITSTKDEDAQHRSLQQSGEDLHIKLAQEPANFNIGEIKSENVHIGDRNTIEYILEQKVIYVSVEEIKTREFNQTSPYKGLKKFEPEDKDRFFGRDQFIKDLANELEQANLIVLLGASGSGKSSVVRAGLFSWLLKKWGSRLVSLTFTPDQDPFESLYASLRSYYKHAEAQVAIEGREDTLTQVVTKLRQSDAYWFIFIDQFEELFTTSQADKRDRFIADLVRLKTALNLLGAPKDCPVKIVATMRADFLGSFSPYHTLVEATDKHRPLIAEMRSDELRQAIEQPAAQHGVVFEMGLVEEIIKDVQGQAGYLPLLQYTLNLVWETEVQNGSIHDRTLNISTYRELGGVRGALQKHMNQIYKKFSTQEKLAAKRIFLKLVEIGGDEESETGWKPVRSRASRAEFEEELEQQVITKLIDNNLLISDISSPVQEIISEDIENEKLLMDNCWSQPQEPTIEIAHEVLLTSWRMLNSWIREHRRAITLRKRLNADAEKWKEKKSDDELWMGSKLEQAREIREDPTFRKVLGGFNAEANKFIDASIGLQERRKRRFTTGFISFSIFALTLATVAIWQWQRGLNEQIKSHSLSSKVLFDSNKELDALIEALKAAHQLKSMFFVDTDTQVQVSLTLQHILNELRERNRLEGHERSVNSVIFSHDGKTLASASDDGTIKIWNLDGTVLKTLETGNKSVVTSISFSPDGKLLISASYSILSEKRKGKIMLWKTDGNDKPLKEWQGHDDEISRVVLSPDGKTIASASYDRTIKLWRIDGSLQKVLSGHNDWVKNISFSSDGKILLSCSKDGTIKLWRLDGTVVKSWKGDEYMINSVSFSPDNKTIISAGSDFTIKLWSVDGRLLRDPLEGHTDTISSITFSHDGQLIASASKDLTVRIWKFDGTLLNILKGHTSGVQSVSFSPDDSLIASASDDNTVRLWNPNRQPYSVLQQTDEGVNAVSFSEDGQYLATASKAGLAVLHSNGSLLNQIRGDSELTSVAFSPDSKVIAASSSDSTTKLWRLNGTLLAILKGHSKSVNSVSFRADGKMIATGSSDKSIKLWNPDGSLIKTLNGHNDEVYAVRFSPNGKLLASASKDNTVKLWNLDGTLIKTYRGHRESVTAIAFSLDNKLLASASEDSTIKLWRVNGDKPIKTLTGHTEAIRSIAFSPSGNLIASGSSDKTVKLWNLDGKELETFKAYNSDVIGISFSPDGTLAVGSLDKAVILWNTTTNLKLLQSRGCDLVKSYLLHDSDPSFTYANLCNK